MDKDTIASTRYSLQDVKGRIAALEKEEPTDENRKLHSDLSEQAANQEEWLAEHDPDHHA